MKFVNKTYGEELHPSDIFEKTCLLAAAWHHRLEVVKRLVRVKEIDVNKCDKRGSTPLHYACHEYDNRASLEIARVKSFSRFHLIEPNRKA